MVKSFCKTAKKEVFTLPKLPFAYNALEPHIDEETIKLHHDKHHAKYVEELNKAIEEGNAEKIAFNGAGHFLHTLYWQCLVPGVNEPSDDLEVVRAIKETFGSFDKFRDEFLETTKSIQGSGWGALALDNGKLVVMQIEKHQEPKVKEAQPILVIDIWEHAYYLKYKNDRAEHVEKVFDNLLNWENIERLYKAV